MTHHAKATTSERWLLTSLATRKGCSHVSTVAHQHHGSSDTTRPSVDDITPRHPHTGAGSTNDRRYDNHRDQGLEGGSLADLPLSLPQTGEERKPRNDIRAGRNTNRCSEENGSSGDPPQGQVQTKPTQTIPERITWIVLTNRAQKTLMQRPERNAPQTQWTKYHKHVQWKKTMERKAVRSVSQRARSGAGPVTIIKPDGTVTVREAYDDYDLYRVTNGGKPK